MQSKSKMTIIVALLIVGFLAGALSGMVGIGGGIILVPAFVYFLNMSQQQAQGTTLAMFLMPIGILGVYNYYQKGYVDVKIALLVAITFVLGSYFGSKIAISVDQAAIRKIFGVTILLVALKMIFDK